MNLMEILTVCIGSYGLAFTQANLPGPFGLSKVLKKVVLRYGGRTEWVRHGLGCPICLSFWFAVPVSFLVAPSVSVRSTFLCSCCSVGFASVVYVLSPPDPS